MRDIHAVLLEQAARIADLTTEVRLSNQRVEQQATSAKDHEDRLRAVERKVWAIPSLAALIGLAGLAVNLFK